MRRREDPAEAAEAEVHLMSVVAAAGVDLISAVEVEVHLISVAAAEPPWVAAAECRTPWVAVVGRILAERLVPAVARISAACPVAERRALAARVSVVHLILPAGRRYRMRSVLLSMAGVRLRLTVRLFMASVPLRSAVVRAGLPTGRRRWGLIETPQSAEIEMPMRASAQTGPRR